MTTGTPALSAPPRSREAAALDIAVKALEAARRIIIMQVYPHGYTANTNEIDRALADIATLRGGAQPDKGGT